MLTTDLISDINQKSINRDNGTWNAKMLTNSKLYPTSGLQHFIWVALIWRISTFGVSAELFLYVEGLSTSMIFFHVDCLSIKVVAKSMPC